MKSAFLSAVLLLGMTVNCGRNSNNQVIRLVDLFDPAKVEGAPSGKAPESATLWDFNNAGKNGADATLGWKAGDGVSGLKAVNGKLTGKSTTDFPIIYVAKPKAVQPGDGLDSVVARLRVSAGTEVSASNGGAKLDFPQIIGRGRGLPWFVKATLTPGEQFQSVTLPVVVPTRMNWDNFLVRPTNAANATFEIETIQVVSQRERRASIKSGVGWQGLGDIYRETLVSRSPEKFQIDVDVPQNAWLDLGLGTVEELPVTFKLAAVSGGREQLLLTRTLTTAQRWEPVAVDLSAISGKTTLRFWLDTPNQRMVGFWGSPIVRPRNLPSKSVQAGPLGQVEAPQGVILMMCDTLRKDHLPVYGYKRDTAPNLNKMASSGTVFLDNISQATWTKVATPSIMTSLYPKSHRIHDFSDRLSASADTLAEQYRKAGYATISFSSVIFNGKFTNLQQGFDELHESASADDPKYPAKNARTYVDRAIQWIERRQGAPFFMYLHVFDPHDPFEPRAPYDGLYADLSKKEKHEADSQSVKKFIENPLMKAFGMPNRAEMQKAGLSPDEYVGFDKDWYDGSIRGMDAELGRLLEYLRESGLEGKVQFAFIADHGEEFIEHGRMFHGQTPYGELSGVPLILYRPGVIPAGKRVNETTRSIDLMPTLLTLSGLPVPSRAQGQSLVPLLTSLKGGWKNEPAVTEKALTKGGAAPPPGDTESYALVHDGWKLVHNVHRHPGVNEFELYNHAEDPLDLKDVAAQHAGIVEKLKPQLAAWHKKVEADRLPEGGQSEKLSQKEMERLKSLGYVQ